MARGNDGGPWHAAIRPAKVPDGYSGDARSNDPEPRPHQGRLCRLSPHRATDLDEALHEAHVGRQLRPLVVPPDVVLESDPHVAEWLAGKTIAKTIVVPGRMVNFVVK